MDIRWVDSTPSTNSLIDQLGTAGAPAGIVVAAKSQTAGRGQRGNSWESEPGCNLTFSVLLRPHDLLAVQQFALSEAVSLGLADALEAAGLKDVTIKWPNDIYLGDGKVAGILITHVLEGKMIGRSTVGIGINVNQTVFLSDAPNPVSMRQMTGKEYDLELLLVQVCRHLEDRLTCLGTMHSEYLSRLWRRNGLHSWQKPGGEAFQACIADVASTGHLTLRRPEGLSETFAFKEVAAVL